MHELERHLGEAHRQAARLVRHQAELGEAVREFGAAMAALGRYEEWVRRLKGREGQGVGEESLAGWVGAGSSASAERELGLLSLQGGGPACPTHPLTHPHRQGMVAEGFGHLGERAAAASKLCAETSTSLSATFEAPLKEFVRTVGAAKKVMADRSAALQAYQQVGGWSEGGLVMYVVWGEKNEAAGHGCEG